jgi:hypothetical protein
MVNGLEFSERVGIS